MDTLRFLTYFDSIEKGKISLLSTWDQGEHRGIIAQLYVYISAKYFHLNIFASVMSISVIIAISAFTICVYFLKSINKLRINLNLHSEYKICIIIFLIFNTIYIAFFSWANWEVFSLDVGFVLFFKNLLFITYWICLDNILREKRPSIILKILLSVISPIIIIFLSMGWCYSFSLSVIFCCFIYVVNNRGDVLYHKIFIKILCAVIIISLLAYILCGKGVHIQSSYSYNTLKNIFISYCALLASIFLGAETLLKLDNNLLFTFIVLIGITLSLWLLYLIILNIIKKIEIFSYLPIAFISYGFFVAVSIAIGRGSSISYYAVASRYFMDLSFLFLGLMWLSILIIISNYNNQKRKLSVIILTIVCLLLGFVFIFGQLKTNIDEWKKAPYRNLSFQNLHNLTLKNNITESEVAIFQSSYADTLKAISIQKEYKIGVYNNSK
jgi:hypothetical protein